MYSAHRLSKINTISPTEVYHFTTVPFLQGMLCINIPQRTCSFEVKPDVTEAPHHVLELQQEREQTVVFAHAAVSDDDVEWPVHLKQTKDGKKKKCVQV